MATLQKIRNRGKILIFTVGLALFAFIAEEFVRSLSYTQTERHQRVGKIYGDKINVQEFNAQVEEYTDVVKFTQGVNTLSDDQLSMMRDQVWQTLVNDKVMQHECEKLGITVTDAEMQDIINSGRNPMLAQTPFRTAQGTFDVNALKQFLNQYNEVMTNPELNSEIKEQYQQMNNYWKFIEKTIRRQTLNNKYQALLNGLMVSNPVAAQASFDGRTNETDIYMAALPFTSIKDDDVKVEDSELKAKYEELKELFRTEQETRDIKYIDINVTASDADKANLQKEMEGYAQALAEGADPAKTVREAASQVPYSVLPISAKALPHDIAEKLDSMGVGAQVGPFVHEHDNTINIVRLIGKVSLPEVLISTLSPRSTTSLPPRLGSPAVSTRVSLSTRTTASSSAPSAMQQLVATTRLCLTARASSLLRLLTAATSFPSMMLLSSSALWTSARKLTARHTTTSAVSWQAIQRQKTSRLMPLRLAILSRHATT